MYYGVTLNPNGVQYVIIQSYDNKDFVEIVGGVRKVLKNAQKECARLNTAVAEAKARIAAGESSGIFQLSDEEWSHRIYKVKQLKYEEVTE